MDMAEIVVTVGGAALVAFILWFFFGPKQTAQPQPVPSGAQTHDSAWGESDATDRVAAGDGRTHRSAD